MAANADDMTREYVAAVGAIALAWAHLEFALDALIAVDEELSVSKPRARHPVGFSAKIGRLTKTLKARKPHIVPYEGEWMQVITLGTIMSERRNLIVHGAVMSTLSEPEIQVAKLTRKESDDELEQGRISIHEMFVVFTTTFELLSHTYNLVLRMIREQVPEYAEQASAIGVIDVSGFQWPAVNPRYIGRKAKERSGED